MRIDTLEKKVDKHNGIYDSVYKLQEKCAVTDEKITVANNRIEDLETDFKTIQKARMKA